MANSGLATRVRQLGRELRDSLRIAKFRIKNPNHFEIVEYRDARFVATKDNKIEHMLLKGKAYDRANMAICDVFAKPGAVCIDVGANIGVYSIVLSNLCGTEGEIHAFEPARHIVRRFKFNCLLNGVTNIRLNTYVLGDKNERVAFHEIHEDQYRGGEA